MNYVLPDPIYTWGVFTICGALGSIGAWPLHTVSAHKSSVVRLLGVTAKMFAIPYRCTVGSLFAFAPVLTLILGSRQGQKRDRQVRMIRT